MFWNPCREYENTVGFSEVYHLLSITSFILYLIPCNLHKMVSGLCVSNEFLCDNTNDCGDLSDEQDCEAFPPLCSLEEDELCDWSQESDDDNTG